MADRTGIEWTDASWNPVVGCSLVSPGCTNCYAMGQAARIVRCSEGLGRPSTYDGTVATVKGRPVWTGKVALASDATLTQPLRWKRPRRIFVNSMGDLFHEDVPDAWIDRVFAVMALAPQHSFQILTKRSARMRAYLTDPDLNNRISDALGCMLDGEWIWNEGKRFRDAIEHLIDVFAGMSTDDDGCIVYHDDPMPLPNVWLGVSAEDQRRADERIPDLLATPAAIRFVSAEPLLGPIDFGQLDMLRQLGQQAYMDALDGGLYAELPRPPKPPFPFRDVAKLDWVIVGGESGKDARPMHPDWARSVRDQCADAGMAFFFKQWGEWAPSETARPPKGTLAVLCRDGQLLRGQAMATGRIDDAGAEIIAQFGKARAGRLLDGVTHDAMPEALT